MKSASRPNPTPTPAATRRAFVLPRVTRRGDLVPLTGDQNSWSALAAS